MNQQLQNKLTAYQQLAKGIIKPIAKNAVPLSASALALSMPNVIVAQCNEGSVSGGGAQNAALQIDVDGGGNDFSITRMTGGTTFVFLNVLNPDFSVAGVQNGAYFYPGYYSGNAAISPGANFNNQAQQTLYFYAGSPQGPWAGGNPISGFLGVRKDVGGGDFQYGFVALTIDGIGTGNFTFTGNAMETGVNVNSNQAVSAGMCSTLPVELTTFKATTNDKNVFLNWQTATETDNAGFEVQRSENGKSFKSVTFVDGHGTTLEAQTYNFIDETAQAGKTYHYRLKQIDFDGQFAFSDVVLVTLDTKVSTAGDFFPNPVAGETQLELVAKSDANWTITVYDARGAI